MIYIDEEVSVKCEICISKIVRDFTRRDFSKVSNYLNSRLRTITKLILERKAAITH